MSTPALTAPSSPAKPKRWLGWAALCLLVMTLISLVLTWGAYERMGKVELELTRRQQDTQAESAAARLLSKQAQDMAHEVAAKVTLLETRLSEVALQRTQLEDLIQSLSRSRDENIVADIDAGLRVAQQQSTLTGSAEPLMAALKQADERLTRHNQPRLEPVRRALARDLDRVKAVGVADIAALSIKLDEATRLVDELPMLHQASIERPVPTETSPPTDPATPWWDWTTQRWQEVWAKITSEARSLVRVTRIDRPDAVLLAPEQAFFVRENLKLRLLNARLGLLSRQFETTQSDLQVAQANLNHYFDPQSKRTKVALDLLKQVSASAHSANLPRLDDSLASLSAVAAGR